MRLGQHILDALGAMPDRERQILELRYGERLLLREIAERLQVSPPRIRSLLMRAEYRLARRIIYPGLDPLHRFDRRPVPSNYVVPVEPERPRVPPVTRHWTSEPGPSVALAPFGTLGDVLELVDRYTLEDKIRLVNEVLAHLKGDEPDTKETPSDARRGTLD